eukprot:s2202_g6.t1
MAPEAPEPPVMDHLLFKNGVVQPELDFGHIDTSADEESVAITNLIALTMIDTKLTVARRMLPRSALSRVMNIEVPGTVGDGEEEGDRDGQPLSMDDRMAAVESNVEQIRNAVADIPNLVRAALPPKPVLAGPTPTVGAQPGPPAYKGLDPGVVASARSAAIPEDRLAKVASLLTKQPPLMADLPRQTKKTRNILSEADDDDVEL